MVDRHGEPAAAAVGAEDQVQQHAHRGRSWSGTLAPWHEVAGHPEVVAPEATPRWLVLVPEEVLTHLTNLSGGPEADVKRADMVYFKTAKGGQVFATGSITFCGSLPWNEYDNNISTLLGNVVHKFTKG